mmetsp:Transcript_2853/g.5759  ORF Transcript_2853/g.5759 Transcript_2853/m.5759 type:complete len:82 (+) Transcript_2853:67-312(+)
MRAIQVSTVHLTRNKMESKVNRIFLYHRQIPIMDIKVNLATLSMDTCVGHPTPAKHRGGVRNVFHHSIFLKFTLLVKSSGV